jgi:enoyl-CoA hydratase/carnithine racemase
MEYKDIHVEVHDAIATVTLNRPQKLNAYTNLMGDELTHAYESLGKRSDVRVIMMMARGAASVPGRISAGCSRKALMSEIRANAAMSG